MNEHTHMQKLFVDKNTNANRLLVCICTYR